MVSVEGRICRPLLKHLATGGRRLMFVIYFLIPGPSEILKTEKQNLAILTPL